MTILLRNLTDKLKQWCTYTNRSPLVLRGARQVGKTFVVKQFAQENFGSMAYVNFEQSPELIKCFIDLDPKKILSALELALNQDIQPETTLLFLDEIQECPKALIALRYFKENMAELAVIAAGSLLEFVLNEEALSMPVGRVEYLYVKPLSFNEFLLACDKSRLLFYLKELEATDSFQQSTHDQLLQIVQEYMSIGGMPAVVAEYVGSHHLNRCEDLLSDLILTYREDFGKYAKKTDHQYLQKLYDKAPNLVAQWFKYVKVDEDCHPRNLRVALELLSQANIISRVYATSASGIPLASTQNDKKFKLLFLDTGLVRVAQQIKLDLIYHPKLILLNQGALTEQFVGQELLAYAHKIQQNKLFSWQREERNAQAEVDYLYIHNGEIYPVEVKAGGVGRLKSLKIFMQEKHSKIGIRVSSLPLSFEQNILSVPFYMISEIPRLIEWALTK